MRRSTFTVASLAMATVGRPHGVRASEPLSVLYAGSLVTPMERSVAPALAKQGIDFRGEAKGSLALANLIAGGLRQPDVFISADPKLIDGLMEGAQPLARWEITFATTRLVVGYARGSRFADDFQRVARREKKIGDVLLEPGLRLGRTDPALDPKGYRSIIATKLLARGGGPPDLARRLLGAERNPAQILPEETLLARLESGDVDAAFLYATEAIARNVPFAELPVSANLGDPEQAAHYAS
ncbi:MAG: substrate-binding domain-containing protein, partial [Candidatus Eremiobacteraeota bacterium]|nr:substrate-binding domain-containing protein [Candidatus Eremiobacteraeota bacterium]